jgi:hypothetical protein
VVVAGGAVPATEWLAGSGLPLGRHLDPGERWFAAGYGHHGTATGVLGWNASPRRVEVAQRDSGAAVDGRGQPQRPLP